MPGDLLQGELRTETTAPRLTQKGWAAIPVCPGLGISWALGLSVLKPGQPQANQHELVTPHPDLTQTPAAPLAAV